MSKPFSTLPKSLVEAAVIAATTGVIALAINLVHPNKIPVFASEDYETMVPCPVQEGHVTAITASDLPSLSGKLLIVDAREEAEFKDWHYPNALHVVYDFLDPIPDQVLRNLARRIASMQATKVVVYGDGATPDTGKLLGIDISAAGINNVYFVMGGATALKTATEKQKAETK